MPQNGKKHCIQNIKLSDDLADHHENLIEKDRDAALQNLKQDSQFKVLQHENGPYSLAISIEENRLVLRMQDAADEDLPILVLSLKPYKRLIKDYFIIMRSYHDAVADGKPSRIEAIDMGRRGLHNEGAQLLMDRLEEKIEMDFDTGRRLFTLICVLHDQKSMGYR